MQSEDLTLRANKNQTVRPAHWGYNDTVSYKHVLHAVDASLASLWKDIYGYAWTQSRNIFVHPGRPWQ